MLRYVRATCTGIARGVVRQRIYNIKQHSRTASFIDLAKLYDNGSSAIPYNLEIKMAANIQNLSKETINLQQLKQCVYCENDDHRSVECTKVVDVGQRKRILSIKRRCFNCTGEKHRASECKSKTQCYKCQRKHHTSICDKAEPSPTMCQPNQSNVIYPVVVVEVEGVKCRALLDTGSGNSYVSSTLMNLTKKKLVRQKIKTIEMTLHTTTKKIDVYNVKITNINKNFSMSSEVNCVVDQCY